MNTNDVVRTQLQYARIIHAAAKIDELLNTLSGAHCKYIMMSREYLDSLPLPELARDNHEQPLQLGDDYMVITAQNGTRLYVNVNKCSPYAACAEVFNYIQYHL